MKSRNPQTGQMIFHALAKTKAVDIKILIDKFSKEYGVKMDDEDKNGNTPIMAASGRGNLDFIKILHEKFDIDLKKINKEGQGILHLMLID